MILRKIVTTAINALPGANYATAESDALPAPAATLRSAGEACATLTPEIRKTLQPLAPGTILEVIAEDPDSRQGIPAWCRLTGHRMLAMIAREDGTTRFLIRRK